MSTSSIINTVTTTPAILEVSISERGVGRSLRIRRNTQGTAYVIEVKSLLGGSGVEVGQFDCDDLRELVGRINDMLDDHAHEEA